ncbi:MAG: ferritin family protein [Bacteroidetes bacterium]|nr:ferritin family protein [Bacteroidota bacterium]
MREFKSIDDILDFAIDEEQKAVDFYTSLASKATSDDMRKVFEEFAGEEVTHKMRLVKVKEEGLYEMKPEKVADLRIVDFLVNVKPTPDMTYQDALIVAMNKEKAAFKLYMTLSDRAESSQMKELFLGLAQEESKHKLRFELEYDEYVYREN